MKLGIVTVLTTLALSMTTSAVASEVCYELSTDGSTWSRSPSLMCIEAQGDRFTIELATQNILERATFATFHVDLLERVRCPDCNQDLYGTANPSNSLFQALQIRFDGEVNMQTWDQQGTVSIGDQTFYYRSFPRAGNGIDPSMDR